MKRTSLTWASLAGALFFIQKVALAGMTGSGAQPWVPEANTKAFWVETSICTVVVKTPIDVSKPIQAGTPIDLVSSMPAICTSSVTGQNQIPGGVRSLLASGFRVTAVSHHVAVLSNAVADQKAELLISAIFSLERPQVVGASKT